MSQFSDTVPTTLLKSWPLEADLFDGDVLAGPVPTLFTANRSSALDALISNPEKAHWDIQRLNRAFFQPEYVPISSAADIVNKPRYFSNESN